MEWLLAGATGARGHRCHPGATREAPLEGFNRPSDPGGRDRCHQEPVILVDVPTSTDGREMEVGDGRWWGFPRGRIMAMDRHPSNPKEGPGATQELGVRKPGNQGGGEGGWASLLWRV